MDEAITATLKEVNAIEATLKEADHFYQEDLFLFATLKVTMEEQDIITAELTEQ